MSNQMRKQLLFAAALLGGLAVPARAGIYIINDNLDALSGAANGYTYGDGVNQTMNYVAGAGVGGSVGMVETGDFIGVNGYGGLALQYPNGGVTGNTSASLSNYTLSFDAMVNVANVNLRVILESWQGPNFTPAGVMTGHGIAFSMIATPNVFQHITINLGALALDPYGPTTMPNPTDQTWQFAWELNEWNPYVAPSLGNQLVIDNIQVTMIPEPSSLALCALGMVGGFAFLRRRSA